MPADNIAGAPTEGLGQTVTFAFDPGRAVQQQTLGANQLRLGVQEQGRTGQSTIGGAPITGGGEMTAATLNVLGRIAGNTVEPFLKRAKLEGFSRGVQQAASGQAIQEIADEQPWYATLFGEADAVEGARTYHAANQSLTIQSELQAAMPRLKALGPNEARPIVDEILAKHLTGDTVADAAIQQAYSRDLPGFWKQHAKAYIGHTQEVARTQKREYGVNSMLAFEQAAKDPTQDSIAAMARFDQALDYVPGENPDSYGEDLVHIYTVAGTTGSLKSLDRMEDRVPLMPVEKQRHMETVRAKAEARVYGEVLSSDADIASRVAALRAADRVVEPGAWREAALAINRDYTAKYGGRGPVSPQEIEMGMAAGYDAQYKQAQDAATKAQTAEDKALAAAQETALLDTALINGAGADIIGRGTTEASKVYHRMYQIIEDPNVSAQTKYKILISNPVSPVLRDNIQAKADAAFTVAPGTQPVWGGEQAAQFQKWKDLSYNGGKFNPQGAVAAAGLWGSKRHAMFMDMAEGVALHGKDPGQAYADALVRPNRKPTEKAEADAALKGIMTRPEFNSWFDLKRDTVFTPTSVGVFSQVTKEAMDVYPSLPPEQAAQLHFQTMRKAGRLQVVGSHAWMASMTQVKAGGGMTGFTNAMMGLNQTAAKEVKLPADQVGPAFDLAMEKFGKDLFPDGRPTVQITEGADAAGTPRLTLFIVDEDGSGSRSLYITPNDLLLRASKEYREKLLPKHGPGSHVPEWRERQLGGQVGQHFQQRK